MLSCSVDSRPLRSDKIGRVFQSGVRLISLFSYSGSVKDRVLVDGEMYPLASGPSRKGSGH